MTVPNCELCNKYCANLLTSNHAEEAKTCNITEYLEHQCRALSACPQVWEVCSLEQQQKIFEEFVKIVMEDLVVMLMDVQGARQSPSQKGKR